MALTGPLILSLLVLSLTLVQAAPIETPKFLEPVMPKKGTTIQDEIKCYNLPYGGIGFLSHFLTYWAVFWLGWGRRPYWPWKRLSAGWTDLALSLVQILISIGIAGFTISRCRLRWEFMLIAVWKLVMSVEVGIWGLRASYLVIKHRDSIYRYERLFVDYSGQKQADDSSIIWRWNDWTPYTLIIYSMGMITGMVGLLSIVWQLRHDKQIVEITAAFGGTTLLILLVLAMMLCCCGFGSGRRMVKILIGMVFTVIAVCALYSDWILGDIAGSLVGVPSGDSSALYWIYFAAKRLPLLMT